MKPSSTFRFTLGCLAILYFGCSREKTAQAEAKSPHRKEAPQTLAPRVPSPPSEEEARAFLASLPLATVAIGYITNPDAIAMGTRPNLGTIYNLYLMKVMEKVPGGYFLQWAPPGHFEEGDPVFLQTELDLREDALFMTNEYWAVFTGPFQYQNMRGFNRSIYGFALLTPKPTSQPHDLTAVDASVVYELMKRRSTGASKQR